MDGHRQNLPKQNDFSGDNKDEMFIAVRVRSLSIIETAVKSVELQETDSIVQVLAPFSQAF